MQKSLLYIDSRESMNKKVDKIDSLSNFFLCLSFNNIKKGDSLI